MLNEIDLRGGRHRRSGSRGDSRGEYSRGDSRGDSRGEYSRGDSRGDSRSEHSRGDHSRGGESVTSDSSARKQQQQQQRQQQYQQQIDDDKGKDKEEDEEDEPQGALSMSDAELVGLLKRRPKEVPQLRTKADFLRFFRGVPRRRIQMLLNDAFADLDPDQRAAKVQKRLALLFGEH